MAKADRFKGKAYFFHGPQYSRFDVKTDRVDRAQRNIAGNWPGLPASGVDAAINWGNGKAYFFRENKYWRFDIENGRADLKDEGGRPFPKLIAGNWAGLNLDRVDACVAWGDSKAYFFRKDQYWRYDMIEDRADPDYPKSIVGPWSGLALDAVDGCLNWGNGKVYIFRGDQYWRYDVIDDRVDQFDPINPYPLKIKGQWSGLFSSDVRSPIKLAHGCPTPTKVVRLHIKVLSPPLVAISEMIQNMRRVYRGAGLWVEAVSFERLNLPSLIDVSVQCPGLTTSCCPFPCGATNLNPQHVSLFANRKFVGSGELVVYFVRSLDGLNGCCAFPNGKPGLVVSSIASPWTLAHEIGHVLGLPHTGTEPCSNCNNPVDATFVPTRLMTCCGTGLLTGTPTLIGPEVSTMNASALVNAC
jgi:Hemopexin